jgi:hypothetical protein
MLFFEPMTLLYLAAAYRVSQIGTKVLLHYFGDL